MVLAEQPERELVLPDITPCLLTTEGQQECWQNLFQVFTATLNSLQSQLNAALAESEYKAAKCKQLEEELEENEARYRALVEASSAQARQFSETLKKLRQNQAQIVQAEKMSSLGQLVAGIAHEINNPVNFIYGNISHAHDYAQDLLGLLQLYQQHYPIPVPEVEAEIDAIELDFLMEDLPKLLSSMKVGAERIQKIVLSLRNFSRMDEAAMKEVDIHEGIDSTLMILQNRLKGSHGCSGIDVIKEYSILPPVECYAGQLNQVFMNILANALDALEERSTLANQEAEPRYSPMIKICTQLVKSDRVAIHIIDNGPGITEVVQQRLFDPFFTTKPVGKGTGLGMSISYQIVTEQHGGSLQCISAPGKGAEFVIEVPIKQSGN